MNIDELLDETKQCFEEGEKLIGEGKIDEAIKLFEKALKLQSDKYGDKHESVAVCNMQIGMANMMAYKFVTAKTYFETALDIIKKLYSYNTQEVANCYYLLGNTCMQLEDYENASLNFGHVVLISTNLYGATGQQTDSARTLYNKAMYLNSEKNPNETDKAIAEMTDDLDLFKKGSEYFDGGVAHLAAECFERAIAIRKASGVTEDIKLIDFMRALAISYTEIDFPDKAIEVLKELLTMCIHIHGEESAEVSGTYNFLGYDYLILNEYDKAADNLKKMLAINIKLYGENDPQVVRDYSMISDVYRMKGDIDNALAYAIIVEGILRQVNSDYVEGDLAINYGNLAHLYGEKQDFPKQIEYLEKQLKLEKKLHGEATDVTVHIYNDLAYAYHSLGDMDKSREYMVKTEETFKEFKAHEHDHHDGCCCGHDHGEEHHHHDDDCDLDCHDHEHHHDDDCDCHEH